MDMGNVQTIHRCSGICTNDLQAQGLAVPQLDCHCADIENMREDDNGDKVAQDLKRERVGFMDLTREDNSLPRVINNRLDPQIPRQRVQQLIQLPRDPSIFRAGAHDFVAFCLPGRSCGPVIVFEQSQNLGNRIG